MDAAWAHYLPRDEPLESFYDEFPDDADAVADLWLIVPPPEAKRDILRVQAELELPDLVVVPHYFHHVALPLRPDDRIFDLDPFELRLARVNCFHTAVVAEVDSEALRADGTFLPHLSLAYVERPTDPAPVRDAVVPLPETEVATFTVEELVRARVPVGRTTVLEPWTVVERLALRR